MKTKVDYLIIGGGIVGVTLARELSISSPKSTIKILEKETAPGLHSSGRNSGVIHSGIYYDSQSLKSKLCFEGNRLLKEYCFENKIAIKQCGKILLPTNESQLDFLPLLHNNAKKIGINVSWLDKKSLLEMEPFINCSMERALYVSDTAVADPKLVLFSILKNSLSRRFNILYNALIKEFKPERSEVVLASGDVIQYGLLINAAGLYADNIAHHFGVAERYTIIPFKGTYWKLNSASNIKVKRLVYPIPDPKLPFLGIHSTTNMNNDIFFGPSAIPAFGRENYRGIEGINLADFFNINHALLSQFYSNKKGFRRLIIQEGLRCFKPFFVNAAQKLFPKLSGNLLIKSNKVGIRAQLYDWHEKKLVDDFLVENGKSSLHILNAISPAWTSSLAMAKYLINKEKIG
jgi:L-2-hydroxyglutarate oxidase